MKYANKLNSQFTVVIGDNELEAGEARLKNMADGNETVVSLAEFGSGFERAYLDSAIDLSGVDFSAMTQTDINNLFK